MNDMIIPGVVTIDGNIGAMKSTLLRALKARGLHVDPEPLHEWAPYLHAIVENPEDAACLFAFQERVARDRTPRPPAVSPESLGLAIERSLALQHRVFVAMHRHRWNQDQCAQIDRLYADAQQDWEPSLFVYLRTDPAACFTRAQHRNGPGDNGLTLEYLQEIHRLHEQAFAALQAEGKEVLVLDAETHTIQALVDAIIWVSLLIRTKNN